MRIFFASLLLLLSANALAAGKVQNADVKSLTEVGGVASRLINDTKIYSTNTSTQLSSLMTNLIKQVIPFVYSGFPTTGDNQPWIQIPFAHTVSSVSAVAKTSGSTGSTINIYRASAASVNSGTPVWSSILSTAVSIDTSKITSAASAVQPVVSSPSGSVGDYYKMEFTSVGTDIKDVTIELVITTN